MSMNHCHDMTSKKKKLYRIREEKEAQNKSLKIGDEAQVHTMRLKL